MNPTYTAQFLNELVGFLVYGITDDTPLSDVEVELWTRGDVLGTTTAHHFLRIIHECLSLVDLDVTDDDGDIKSHAVNISDCDEIRISRKVW